jgi:hypothetical protein
MSCLPGAGQLGCSEIFKAEPSKICPACRRCLCDHPAYQEPNFWKDAPAAFRQRGFQRLFLYYL